MKTQIIRQTSLGIIRIEETDGAISALSFALPTELRQSRDSATPLLEEAFTQLLEYLEKKRKEFTIPLAPEGTDFNVEVWNEISKIPYGSTATYGELAKQIGRPKAFRATGTACGRNPVAVFIPCHRVVPANFVSENIKTYGGYYWGVSVKEKLLNLEGI
ncbi:MAG: methylated-DNA--[protein]-cysteine S-methyltransferase [Lentisphaerae bacterium]|jgi:methylated-DNA-[protein]-cysteine S-methyltransferase|nr:methylated-DNA--[protein]-cysteine S-methyltransferase [Lentisphaerota bacterium]